MKTSKTLEDEVAHLRSVIADAVRRCRTCGGKGTIPTAQWCDDRMEEVSRGSEPCWACEALREAVKEKQCQ